MGKRISVRCMVLIIIFSISHVLSGCGGEGGGGGDDVNNTMTLNAVAITPSEVSINWTEHNGSIIGYDLVRNGKSVLTVW